MLVLSLGAGNAWSQEDLSQAIPELLDKEQRAEVRAALEKGIQDRFQEFNRRNRADWAKVQTREQWEAYRDERLAKLRSALAQFPVPAKPNVQITATRKGEGYVLENVVYESRPGLWVTANRYSPTQPTVSMPGILLAHAHHRGKVQNELQDMGMIWARAGCVVLVIDQFGYGERRSHPFHQDCDYSKPYKATRQDYYFRYDSGVQLHLLGDSLLGWMAWDLMRGVDVLLAQPGVDPKRILLLGAVAGGGDPAGVTAALDSRITCCVPFNFGGPQPESKYPLPDDAESSFNFLLFPTYWESTRGLRLGGRDDFPHWFIVASTAPRYLVHGHEFAWDKERDPAWSRYQKIWGNFYKAADHVGAAFGQGGLALRPPEGSHCNQIGSFHRRMIHPLFEKWFGIKAEEYSSPRPPEDLQCLTEQVKARLKPKTPTEVMSSVAQARLDLARTRLASEAPAKQRQTLRSEWGRLLGSIEPTAPAAVRTLPEPMGVLAGAKVERILLEVEPGIRLSVVILRPEKSAKPTPAVIGLAQAGKSGFLQQRSAEIKKLVQSGVAVVLPDLRALGENRLGTSRGRESSDTNVSAPLQLFGETLLGLRLRDLRSLNAYLRTRPDIDGKKLALWGDSFTPPNAAGTDYKIPHGVDGWPTPSEPLGGVLALLGALFDEQIQAVYVSGGLDGYQGILTHFAVHVPHDVLVPGVLTVGDLPDLAASLSPRPLRFENLVDARNRDIAAKDFNQRYARAIQQYTSFPQKLTFSPQRTSAGQWLAEQLR